MWEQINSIEQINLINNDDSILKFPDDHTQPEIEIPTGDEKNSTKYKVSNKTSDSIELFKEMEALSMQTALKRSVLLNDFISGTWWYDNGK